MNGRSSAAPATRVPVWLAVATVAVAGSLGMVGAMLAHAALHRSSPPLLPALHGQTTWTPGSRPAPGLEPHGQTAAVAFLGAGCARCVEQLQWTIRRLPASERPVVVVAPAAAAAAWGVRPGRRLLVLVDRKGDERTGYAFPFVPAFVEGDLRLLGAERP